MGPVAGGGGEEEAENLRAVDTLRNVFNSFAKTFAMREDRSGSQQKGYLKRVSKVPVVGV